MDQWTPSHPFDPSAPLEPGEPFVFNGSEVEYARIWIVNLLLTIVTFGIYSAWAKVRRLRYFYGNTLLQGHGFDYHADPVRILIGRLIVVGTLFAVNLLSNVSPLFFLLLVPYFVALPWMINQSMAFNAQMTSYRNVRFSFRGEYFPSCGSFLFMPLVAMLSGSLLAPLASQVRVDYVGRNLRFGTARFDTRARLKPLYANWGVTLLFLLVGFAVIFGLILVAGMLRSGHEDEQTSAALAFAIIIAIYGSVFLAFYVYRAGVRNVAFQCTTLEGGHRLSSRLSRRRYLWIMLTNAAMVICSLGLLWPIAAVRSWRYLVASTQFHAAGPLDGFVDQLSKKGNVAAAEYLELGGFDFGL